MNQEIQPLFEIDAIKVAAGSTPDPEVAALPKRRRTELRDRKISVATQRRGMRRA
ncbi:MAG: hypothetical protein ACREXK_05380 [Gammaproteobacteria bacterium]